METPTDKQEKIHTEAMDRAIELEMFIADAYAYLGWELNLDPVDRERILQTLVHDISGFARGERCFSPRVSGYAGRMTNK